MRLALSVAVVLLLAASGLTSCEGTNWKSSVPRYGVNMIVDTNSGMFVHFVPTALGQYVILDKEGYHYNGNTLPRTVTDMSALTALRTVCVRHAKWTVCLLSVRYAANATIWVRVPLLRRKASPMSSYLGCPLSIPAAD